MPSSLSVLLAHFPFLADLIDKGGWVATILIIYSIIGLAIILECLGRFLIQGTYPYRLSDDALLTWFLAHADESGKYFKKTILRIAKALNQAKERGVENLHRVSERLCQREYARLIRGLPTLSLLAQTATLLGLLGTVVGMIKAFRVIELAGGKVDASSLAGGIWEAMITTALGLSVAIPFFIALHLFQRAAKRRQDFFKRATALFLEHHSIQKKETKE
ncbi:MotA/TolQ/ExbB proton channel family protein [Magnetococcales bacterium HHB-1]